MSILHAPPRLPIPPTPLIGREREVRLAHTLLERPHVRLLTITGPGGIGKTRLGLQIASDLIDAYADGVRFVPLAAVADASLVPASLAAALHVQETSSSSVYDVLVAALRDTETLILIDNFEHLLSAAPFLTELLEDCPRLKLLVTSRSLLRVDGEHALPVPPLALPALDPSHDGLIESPAVRLFADRAQAVRPAFDLSETTAPIVAEICRRLDGMPLAIELAAARVTHLSLSSLQTRLEQRLPMLTGGARDRPDRHRTLRDAIAWSHDLLRAEEQTLFHRLAVFAGGFGVEAAETLIGQIDERADNPENEPPSGAPPVSVLEGIATLVDASLLQYEIGDDGTTRYRMLETIREFAAEQLAGSGEERATLREHAAFFLAFAEQHSSTLYLPYEESQLLQLDTEEANLRAALVWLEANGEAPEFARLAVALGWFWLVRGHLRDGRAWLERASALGDATPVSVQINLGHILGLVAIWQGDLQRAGEVLIAGLIRARETGDTLGQVQSLVLFGGLAHVEGRFEDAVSLLEEALALARSLPDPRLATSLSSAALANLGVAVHGLGQLETATSYFEAALAGRREVGDIRGTLHSLLDLGDVALSENRAERAATFYRESLAMARTYSEQRVIADALEGLGCADAEIRPGHAARLFAAAERLRETTGITVREHIDEASRQRGVAIARESLGEDAFAASWAAGRALPFTDAIAEALDTAQAPAPPPDGPFTPREMEILQLLVTGLPDRAIADALFLSVRTIENHVKHILAKLNVHTRTAAVSAAITAGFVDPASPPP